MVMSVYVGLLSPRDDRGLAADMDPLMECLCSGEKNRHEKHEDKTRILKDPQNRLLQPNGEVVSGRCEPSSQAHKPSSPHQSWCRSSPGSHLHEAATSVFLGVTGAFAVTQRSSLMQPIRSHEHPDPRPPLITRDLRLYENGHAAPVWVTQQLLVGSSWGWG